MSRAEHWQDVYARDTSPDAGWYERDPVVSRRLVEAAVERGCRSLIDVGGGTALLVDHALEMGLDRVAVLDLAPAALARSQQRLGERAGRVEWILGDLTTIDDVGRFDIWHDRAVFHFLTGAPERLHYVDLARRTVPPGGTAIIATFAGDGPDRCSGLPVCRYEPDALARELGSGFRLEASQRYAHTTPRGVIQRYIYATFSRLDPGDDAPWPGSE